MKYISLKHIMISGTPRIGLQYYNDKVINSLVKQLPYARWSIEHNMVSLPHHKDNISLIYNTFRGVAWVNGRSFYANSSGKEPEAIDMSKIQLAHSKMGTWKKCPGEYKDKLERNHYSLSTAKTYLSEFEKFINHYKDIEINTITDLDIDAYLLVLTRKNLSISAINTAINAIKFYFEKVLGMPNRLYKIDRPRKEEKLPTVISKEEVKAVIAQANNIKHKCVMSILYSAGLRRAELINLKISDIDSKRMLINVRKGKGNKDRITLLSQTLLIDLRIYFTIYKPKLYLFEGEKGGQYSGKSIENVVKNAAVKAGIKTVISPHTLRHCFATHLMEAGTDIRYIQSLLGHSSSKTTEIYTHVATNIFSLIKNPLD